jgi:hypothetical protein
VEVLIERACGLDVHKKSITACIVTPEGKEIKTFRTHTVFLLQMIGWIKRAPLQPCGMESTSVFWKPIVNLLEAEDIEFLVVNAQHIKAVPGCKKDVKDAEWICDLLRHGLLKASYIRIATSANYGSWSATVAVSFRNGPANIIGYRRFLKEPTSNLLPLSPTS